MKRRGIVDSHDLRAGTRSNNPGGRAGERRRGDRIGRSLLRRMSPKMMALRRFRHRRARGPLPSAKQTLNDPRGHDPSGLLPASIRGGVKTLACSYLPTGPTLIQGFFSVQLDTYRDGPADGRSAAIGG